jgi:hypothetical protein
MQPSYPFLWCYATLFSFLWVLRNPLFLLVGTTQPSFPFLWVLRNPLSFLVGTTQPSFPFSCGYTQPSFSFLVGATQPSFLSYGTTQPSFFPFLWVLRDPHFSCGYYSTLLFSFPVDTTHPSFPFFLWILRIPHLSYGYYTTLSFPLVGIIQPSFFLGSTQPLSFDKFFRDYVPLSFLWVIMQPLPFSFGPFTLFLHLGATQPSLLLWVLDTALGGVYLF